MTTSETVRPTSARKGRPNSHDQEYILAHFSTQLALGRTIKAIAADGITFLAQKVLPDGIVCVSIARVIKGKTLERRYRALRQGTDYYPTVATVRGIRETMRYIGISAPTPSLSFPKPEGLKRGRPKKVRSR